MNSTSPVPSVQELKQQAKRLRARLAEDGDFVSHSESLELIARQYGKRDWNTLYAAAGNRPRAPLFVGARIKGRYLGQAFEGDVIAVNLLSPGRTRVTVVFDDAVDVVAFDSFSAFRHRVTTTIGNDGKSAEKTSDGVPQFIVEAVQ